MGISTSTSSGGESKTSPVYTAGNDGDMTVGIVPIKSKDAGYTMLVDIGKGGNEKTPATNTKLTMPGNSNIVAFSGDNSNTASSNAAPADSKNVNINGVDTTAKNQIMDMTKDAGKGAAARAGASGTDGFVAINMFTLSVTPRTS